MISGRKNWESRLQAAFGGNTAPVAWFHAASLGEFEQGRPVMEAFHLKYPEYKLLVTFFSPSGYEVRKDYPLAFHVDYLPLDSPRNARKFLRIVNPAISFFMKYEFWFYYFKYLNSGNVPIISISSIFPPSHIAFRWYGGSYRRILRLVTHFFVQNVGSVKLLQEIGLKNMTLSGDTRFDRVAETVRGIHAIEPAAAFAQNQRVLVAGSTWPEDMELIHPLINDESVSLKYIIAPHEIREERLNDLEKRLSVPAIRYSRFSKAEAEQYQVLIIDNIGLLASLYQYAWISYVGGALGPGLHNILEPAAFGVPVIFGDKNYQKYQEAIDLIRLGGAAAIGSSDSFRNIVTNYINSEATYKKSSQTIKTYMAKNTGATDIIMRYVDDLMGK